VVGALRILRAAPAQRVYARDADHSVVPYRAGG